MGKIGFRERLYLSLFTVWDDEDEEGIAIIFSFTRRDGDGTSMGWQHNLSSVYLRLSRAPCGEGRESFGLVMLEWFIIVRIGLGWVGEPFISLY